ncbi:MAG: FeoB-associated Cys-rich membrane protein [Clostridia bacterium]|nr:FeoB-associated Cys-rich membrane protein [Clostridia bacterium]
MLSWLAANIGTVLITLLLIAVVAVIVVKLHRDKKKGASSCGGNCAHCAMSGTCHRKQ